MIFAKPRKKQSFYAAKQLQAAPQKPGVYIFKKGRVILYVGKAANLRIRLRSYTHPHDLDPAKRAMAAEATSLSFEETANDIEALLKEAQFIKRYRPKYNVLLRDDKNYSFVGFTKERFPKVFVTHQPFVHAQNHVGPFTDGAALKKTLYTLRRIFPYCVCKKLHTRLCQYAQMRLCLGYCCIETKNKIENKNKSIKFSAIAKNITYRKNIVAIRAILSGRRVDVIKKLKKEMRMLSRTKRFEEAANIRDQHAALERIFAHRPFLQHDTQTEHEKGLRLLQTIAKLPSFPHRIEAYDISHHHGKESVGSMVVFEDGKPAKSYYRKFIIRHVSGINDPAMVKEVLTRRLCHIEWPMPNFILIDGGKPQLNAALLALHKHPRYSVPCHGKIEGIATKIIIGALAKREEELYLPNKKPIALKTMPPTLLHLLQHLRNEAHRFAISFSKHRFRKQQIL